MCTSLQHVSEPSTVCILLSHQVMLSDEVVMYCWSKYDLQFIVHVLLTLFGACASYRNTLLVYFIGYLVAAYIDKRYTHTCTWTTADMYLYSMQIPSLHNHAYIQNEMLVTARVHGHRHAALRASCKFSVTLIILHSTLDSGTKHRNADFTRSIWSDSGT